MSNDDEDAPRPQHFRDRHGLTILILGLLACFVLVIVIQILQ